MELLEEIKGYIKITWDDENGNIEGFIQRGKNYLEELTGTKLDFEREGNPRALLFDYCRYAYNNALEYFGENFREDILRLQFQEAVKKRVKPNEN